MKNRIILVLTAAVVSLLGFGACKIVPTEPDSNTKHQPIVEELITILEANPELKAALEQSILQADRLDAPTLPAYYEFLDKMVTMIPEARNLLPQILEFYYLIDNSPSDELRNDPTFQQWTHKFAEDWGSFLDTPESTKELETFYTDPRFHIDDYMMMPSGKRYVRCFMINTGILFPGAATGAT